MRIYKLVFIFIFISILSISLLAQENDYRISNTLDKTQIDEIEHAVSFFWKWDTEKDPIKAVKLLEKISQKEPNNWVAPFWAAFISTQIGRADRNYSEYFEKAQVFIDKANQAFAKEPVESVRPYFHGLQYLIYTFRSSKFSNGRDIEKFKALTDKANQELNKGIKLSPNNPVLMVFVATKFGVNHNGDFEKVISAIALLEKARNEFKKIKDRSPADITYLNEHWIDFWLNRLAPPEKNTS